MTPLENNKRFEGGFNFRKFLIIFGVILLIGYGLFNSRSLLFGPSIEIYEPVSLESETTENPFLIKGRVTNMTYLSMNGRTVFTNQEGVFEERLLLSPGANTIEIIARDRFKTEKQKIIKVYYKSSSPEF